LAVDRVGAGPAGTENNEVIDGLTQTVRGDGMVLTLARPAQRNALSVSLVRGLAIEIEGASERGARAVILTGSPPAFCAGGDLDDLLRIAEGGPLAVTDQIYSAFHRLVRAIASVPIPVIAAVGGPALGAGFDLALCCDLRIASTDAVFRSSWVTMGLVPGMAAGHFLPRTIGTTRAMEALLLGRSISPDQAVAWGLVNEVVPPDDLLTRADEFVAEIARSPRRAVAATKAALRRSIDAGLDMELEILGATQGGLLTGPDFRQAVAQFRSSRSKTAQ
jgi:2-(1,2-epoxy-1,2-dihydrophenyl)acetyl-CoA isomerase